MDKQIILCFFVIISLVGAEYYDKYRIQPYDFGYTILDEYGNKQHRQEKSDESGAKVGSYGFTDSNGIYRHVDYIADKNGFRAIVRTNEPGTATQHSADVEVYAENSPSHTVKPVIRPETYSKEYSPPPKIYARGPATAYTSQKHYQNHIERQPIYTHKYYPRYANPSRSVDETFRDEQPHDQYAYVIAKDQALQSTRTTDLPLYRDK